MNNNNSYEEVLNRKIILLSDLKQKWTFFFSIFVFLFLRKTFLSQSPPKIKKIKINHHFFLLKKKKTKKIAQC